MHARLTAAVMVALQVLASSAQAHEFKKTDEVAETSRYCVRQTSLIREDSSTGTGIGNGTVQSYAGGCRQAAMKGTRNIAERLWIWHRQTEGATPNLCGYTDWYYNTEPHWGVSLTAAFPKKPYCGAGYYEIEGFGYVFWDQGWRGNSLRSGWHYLNG